MTASIPNRQPGELAIVQNPALGAYALWKFGLAFQTQSDTPLVMPLAFIVLPLILHRPTADLIQSTNRTSGFALFVGKLGEKREELLAVHERAISLRALSLESILLGEARRLLTINSATATIRANQLDIGAKTPLLPERIKWITPCCEKLGTWFSALPDEQIVRMLDVRF